LAKVEDSQGLFLRFDAEHAFSASQPAAPAAGDIYLIFLVPKNTDVKSFAVGNRQQDLDGAVHVP
jgi:hypothetical protein